MTTTPYLDRKQAAAYLGLAIKTLEKWAVTGDGPRFRRHGRRVLYHREDLDRWSESRALRSTSEAAAHETG